jgi:hypothetical protein
MNVCFPNEGEFAKCWKGHSSGVLSDEAKVADVMYCGLEVGVSILQANVEHYENTLNDLREKFSLGPLDKGKRILMDFTQCNHPANSSLAKMDCALAVYEDVLLTCQAREKVLRAELEILLKNAEENRQ